jgi:MFS family permease
MNPRRLFVAGCIALITSAFSFMIRQDITDPLSDDFLLTKEAIGAVMGAAFLGMASAMIVMAPLCDWLGMGRVLFVAWMCHLCGILGTIFSPFLKAQLEPSLVPSLFADGRDLGYWILWISTFLVGCGNGLVEIAINPLAATLFPKQKTHYLNVLHAWWPGGLIMAGLLATFVIGPAMGAYGKSAGLTQAATASLTWKLKVGLLLVPLAIYGLMLVGQRFPATERVQANVSTKEMFLEGFRPMFLLWAFCMLLTASTELGPNQWQESVLKRTAHVSGTLVFVYTSGLMFAMRFFAGPLSHRLSPVGMLTCSAALAAIGLFWLSKVDVPVMAFVAATVFGIGIAYFWPTMLGVTAERFPKGGALLLGLMGCFGNLAIWQALPVMGGIYDSYTVANLPADLRDKTLADSSAKPLLAPDGAPLVQTKVGSDGKPVLGADGKPEQEPATLVNSGGGTWLPQVVAERIYPAGTRKLNPDVRKALDTAANLEKQAKEGKLADTPENETQLANARKLLQAVDVSKVEQAEAIGAGYAFRWVAVLPCILVVIFGLIAISDRLRGGYKAVHIHDATGKQEDAAVRGQEEEATPL